MQLQLDGKTFLVTGGSSGLGFATAQALHDEGARVIVNGRDPDRLQDAVAALGGTAEAVAGDLGDPATIDFLLEAAARTGRLDGAFISVGGPPAGTVLGTDVSTWQDEFDTIFLGTLRLLKAIVPKLGDGGAVGVVLSSSVKNPIPGLAVSNGLRPGLAMLIKTLADEVGQDGIRVFGLMPGRIETPRIRALDGDSPQNFEAIPLRRLGRPEEFGRVAAFLLSPAASYITGCVIPVDGGAIRSL